MFSLTFFTVQPLANYKCKNTTPMGNTSNIYLCGVRQHIHLKDQSNQHEEKFTDANKSHSWASICALIKNAVNFIIGMSSSETLYKCILFRHCRNIESLLVNVYRLLNISWRIPLRNYQ